MATKSFYEILVIETEEQGQALLRAFEEAESRPPEPPLVPSSAELIERGNRLLREGFLDHLIRNNGSE
jgi:hypothetical protein